MDGILQGMWDLETKDKRSDMLAMGVIVLLSYRI